MAHFAKIDESNVVLEVLRANDEDASTEKADGQSHLETHNNWPANLWIQTSYNTWANQHKLEGTFRGNFACIGFTWDAANEIFWPPQPYASWTKDNATASWVFRRC